MDAFEKNFNRALKFLSFRPRSEKEIRDYLVKKEVGEETSEKIIAQLYELKFINDEEFMLWLVEQRQGRKPRGMRAIKIELAQKGISRELIESIEWPPENEEELARQASEKKMNIYKNLPEMEFKQKMGQYLARKGFDFDTIRTVIDELRKKE